MCIASPFDSRVTGLLMPGVNIWAEYSLPCTPGNLTVVGYSTPGIVAATHAIETVEKAVEVMVSVDVPFVTTGTGARLCNQIDPSTLQVALILATTTL